MPQPEVIVEAYRRPPSDGSGLRRGSSAEREVHSHVAAGKVDLHVAAGKVDVHADDDALLGHLDQVDAGTDDPHGFTSQ